jgi:hypothetical protein
MTETFQTLDVIAGEALGPPLELAHSRSMLRPLAMQPSFAVYKLSTSVLSTGFVQCSSKQVYKLSTINCRCSTG